jgi:molecular chaperone DnaK
MVRDAESHAEEDMRLKQLAESRNQGDALAHTTRKALEEFGSKLDPADKAKIEVAMKELEDALKANDKSIIDAKISALTTAAQKLNEAMMADTQAPPTGSAAAGASGDASQTKEDDVVDAEFKEVKK